MSLKLILATFFSGLLSSMGFGGGTVLVIYLTSFMSFEQKEAQGINLIFFIFTGIIGLIVNIKNGLVDKTSLKKLLKYALPGVAVGFILLPNVPSHLLKKLFGGALTLMGLMNLFAKRNLKHKSKDTE